MAERDKSSSATANPRRRGFLLTLGTGGVAVVAAVVKPITEVIPEVPSPTPTAGQGYRETGHVRHYYRTTKI